MSKALSRVRALVSEIDAIQNQGRKTATSVPLMKAVMAEPAVQVTPAFQEPASSAPMASVTTDQGNVVSMNARNPEASAQTTSPEGKVFLQLTGKIAIQLQLEHSNEIVEVRQQGETIEIRFTDGKAIHLPLKSVA